MVVRMYGTCDGKDIVFSKVADGQWICIVPADLADGTYIIEIWAETVHGYTIYTTAILYMCDSRCVSLEILDDGFKVHIMTDRLIACVKPDNLKVCIMKDKYMVKVVEKCI